MLSCLRHSRSRVQVNGVVTRRTGVMPQLKLVKYDCAKCHALLGPFTQEYNDQEIKVGRCGSVRDNWKQPLSPPKL